MAAISMPQLFEVLESCEADKYGGLQFFDIVRAN